MVGFPPKSSISKGCFTIHHPFWGTLIFWKPPFHSLGTFRRFAGHITIDFLLGDERESLDANGTR